MGGDNLCHGIRHKIGGSG